MIPTTHHERTSVGRIGVGLSIIVAAWIFVKSVDEFEILLPAFLVMLAVGGVSVLLHIQYDIDTAPLASGILYGGAFGVLIETSQALHIAALYRVMVLVVLGILAFGLINMRYRTLALPALFGAVTAGLVVIL